MSEPGTARWRTLLVVLLGLSMGSFGAMSDAGPDGGGESLPRPVPSTTGGHLDARATEGPPTTTGTVGPTATSRPPTSTAPEPEAEADRPGAAAPMEASVPVRLRIDALGVDTTLLDLGLRVDGTLEVPPDELSAGWYIGAPTPGELGPAVIAGHVDWGGRPGVFFDLHELASGDDIEVTREDGSTARFRVTRVERFAKDTFPTDQVYGDIDHAGLRLITCGGEFDRDVRSYDDNVVVFAELTASDRQVASSSPSSWRTFSIAASTPAT